MLDDLELLFRAKHKLVVGWLNYPQNNRFLYSPAVWELRVGYSASASTLQPESVALVYDYIKAIKDLGSKILHVRALNFLSLHDVIPVGSRLLPNH